MDRPRGRRGALALASLALDHVALPGRVAGRVAGRAGWRTGPKLCCFCRSTAGRVAHACPPRRCEAGEGRVKLCPPPPKKGQTPETWATLGALHLMGVGNVQLNAPEVVKPCAAPLRANPGCAPVLPAAPPSLPPALPAFNGPSKGTGTRGPASPRQAAQPIMPFTFVPAKVASAQRARPSGRGRAALPDRHTTTSALGAPTSSLGRHAFFCFVSFR